MEISKISVRPAVKDDAVFVQILRNNAWQKRYLNPETGVTLKVLKKLAPIPPNQQALEYFERMLSEPNNRDKNLVATLGDMVVGVVFYDELDNGVGDIGVFVDDKFNGKGVGDKLLDALIASTDNSLQVEIFAKNPSRKFYERHGFIESDSEYQYLLTAGVYLPVQALRLDR
jgi:GNAT superfamily N-acetyltransferase